MTMNNKMLAEGTFFKVWMEEEKNKGHIDLFGTIGEDWWSADGGVTAAKVAKMFKDLDPNCDLDISVNSYGGDPYVGLAIKNMIEKHKGTVTIAVTGIAASAASLITSCVNAETVMPTGSMLMIHNPWTYIYGNQIDLRKEADKLEKIAASMATVYKSKVKDKLTDEEIRSIMDAETWLSADEAVEKGFADRVDTLSAKVSALLKGKTLMIGGRCFNLGDAKAPPFYLLKGEKMATKEPSAAASLKDVNGDKGGEVKLTTVAELKVAYPDLVKAAVDEALKAERQRMKDLDALRMPGNEQIVNKAKYETFADAGVCALEILTKEKQTRTQMHQSLKADGSEVSNVIEELDKGVQLNKEEKDINYWIKLAAKK